MNCKNYAGQLNATGKKFAVVVSRFNELFTKQLLAGALDCLARHGADAKNVTVVWVPGAFEQPVALKKLAATGKYDALIALGAVVQGATPHAAFIGSHVTRALTQISLESGLPLIDGIVTAETLDQAIERCGTKAGNRGWNAAQSAIEMADLLPRL